MSKLYASPLRVYLLLGSLALIGIYSGLRLPISLFPNSSKPKVGIEIPYGNMTGEEFLNTYGRRLEEQVRNISTEKIGVEKLEANYDSHNAHYNVEFRWGVTPTAALKEVQTVVNAFASQLPQESRDSIGIWSETRGSGFLALSFYSDKRSLDDLYDLIEPILTPKLTKVKDAQDPEIWNPSRKEVRIELNPQAMGSLQLFPRDVETAVSSALGGRTGGSVTIGLSQLQIEMPRQISKVNELGKIPILTPSGRSVHLAEIAHVDLGPKTMDARIFTTNGAPSLILYAEPRPGGNVKKMSEDILEIVRQTMPKLPTDVQYRVIVDPSEFIRSAVNNVFHEVVIAALLAVAVLFVFIGSFRNVVTAAIEIPLSMILAFILMRFSGMNLNLISLGGLALSAGMNVDASVVVMENIFRHFEMEKEKGPHDFAARLKIITAAVNEVRFPVIASTISSLVVFLPLTFTSDLSYAILGDLALAVVFSHGFSAFVALLLVPTVRLQLMGMGNEKTHHSPIEKWLKKLDEGYGRLLGAFIKRPKLKFAIYGGLALLLGVLALSVLPRLPREIIGKPDTDWMTLVVKTQGNTLLKQMELQMEEVEHSLLNEFGTHIQYTFDQMWSPNQALFNGASQGQEGDARNLETMEKRFTNTPQLQFSVNPWNPSELPIPNPPDMLLSVRGGELQERREVTQTIKDLLQEKKAYPRLETTPYAGIERAIFLEPHIEQWAALQSGGARFTPADLADVIRVATNGRRIGYYPIKGRLTEVVLRYAQGTIQTAEDVGAFPIGVGPKLIPLKALAGIKIRQALPPFIARMSESFSQIRGRNNTDDSTAVKAASLAKPERWWRSGEPNTRRPLRASQPTVTFEDAGKDLNEAIRQLGFAVALSILLIFLTLVVQFGSFAEPLLVLVSVPLGFIGVLVSLFVFRSTLSLNSILGVILLNGIAVANSIILVDFIKRLVEQGQSPAQAAVDAARKRLRPILITSLTTGLGMLPIALGLGEGGRILQPLGIAVAGGLWVSMGLTLFLVPALQVSYLEWRLARKTAPAKNWGFARSGRASFAPSSASRPFFRG